MEEVAREARDNVREARGTVEWWWWFISSGGRQATGLGRSLGSSRTTSTPHHARFVRTSVGCVGALLLLRPGMRRRPTSFVCPRAVVVPRLLHAGLTGSSLTFAWGVLLFPSEQVQSACNRDTMLCKWGSTQAAPCSAQHLAKQHEGSAVCMLHMLSLTSPVTKPARQQHVRMHKSAAKRFCVGAAMSRRRKLLGAGSTHCRALPALSGNGMA